MKSSHPKVLAKHLGCYRKCQFKVCSIDAPLTNLKEFLGTPKPKTVALPNSYYNTINVLVVDLETGTRTETPTRYLAGAKNANT